MAPAMAGGGETLFAFEGQWGPFTALLTGTAFAVLLLGYVRRLGRNTAARITRNNEIEERYRATFDNAPVGIMHTAVEDYRILRANRKLCEMLGYDQAELLGISGHQILHPAYRGSDRTRYLDQMLSGELQSFTSERIFIRKDGTPLWVNRTVSLVRDSAGAPLYFIRIIEDISERKRAEQEQQRKVDMARLLGALARAANEATSPLAAMRVCLELICSHGGWVLGRLGIYASGDGEHFPETSLWHPEGCPQYEPLVNASSNTRYFAQSGRFISVVLKEKKPVWLADLAAVPEFGRMQVALECGLKSAFAFPAIVGGKVAAFLEFFDEATREPDAELLEGVASVGAQLARLIERKRAEEDTAREQTLLRTIIDTVPDFIYVKDAEGRFALANRAWLKERNLGRDDIAGKTVFDIFPPALAERAARQDATVVKTGVPLLEMEQSIVRRTADGRPAETRWALVSKVPMADANGNIIGTVGISRDVTERKLSAQRRDMEHTATRVLAEAASVADAMPRLIRTVCEAMGWAYGARWSWDPVQNALCRSEYWCEFEPDFDALDREYWLRTRDVGNGRLIRRVWRTKAPTWLTHLRADASFRRRPSLLKFGWDSVYCFPIMAGNDIIGIMEFYGPQSQQPDEMLLQTTGSICSQIGQFIARKQAEERVRHLAHYDELTGLPNRNMFNQRLSHAFAQAQRHGKPLAILFIDLDRFKNINDTLGHDAGDRVLREAAQRLSDSLRESDTIGRLGGDEFVVLVEELLQPVQAGAVAQKILAAVAQPFVIDGNEFHVTGSIGISIYPEDADDIPTLLKNADIAMYRAKENGRNNYQFYSARTNVHSIERLTLETGLRRALERGELVVHYQPQVGIENRSIHGMEALVRWEHPTKGLLAPSQFISLAEETGLIVPVGEWVLRTACAQAETWRAQGLVLRIAVNLSARQFAQEELLQVVARILYETGLDPKWLELEITESMVMRDPAHAATLLAGLKSIGLQLAIDDFGTGYSSLAYLKRFPIDTLKIDRSFVRDIPGDRDDVAITQAVIAMTHSLGLRAVAEGVETRDQWDFLRRHGCDEMQGYYVSPPLPAAQATAFLLQQTLADTA